MDYWFFQMLRMRQQLDFIFNLQASEQRNTHSSTVTIREISDADEERNKKPVHKKRNRKLKSDIKDSNKITEPSTSGQVKKTKRRKKGKSKQKPKPNQLLAIEYKNDRSEHNTSSKTVEEGNSTSTDDNENEYISNSENDVTNIYFGIKNENDYSLQSHVNAQEGTSEEVKRNQGAIKKVVPKEKTHRERHKSTYVDIDKRDHYDGSRPEIGEVICSSSCMCKKCCKENDLLTITSDDEIVFMSSLDKKKRKLDTMNNSPSIIAAENDNNKQIIKKETEISDEGKEPIGKERPWTWRSVDASSNGVINSKPKTDKTLENTDTENNLLLSFLSIMHGKLLNDDIKSDDEIGFMSSLDKKKRKLDTMNNSHTIIAAENDNSKQTIKKETVISVEGKPIRKKIPISGASFNLCLFGDNSSNAFNNSKPTDKELKKQPTDKELKKQPTDKELKKQPTDKELKKSENNFLLSLTSAINRKLVYDDIKKAEDHKFKGKSNINYKFSASNEGVNFKRNESNDTSCFPERFRTNAANQINNMPDVQTKPDKTDQHVSGTMAKYEVPEHLLDKLKCGLCYEYLSYPPIINYAETGSVCGRCPTLEAEKDTRPLREESYERVARSMLTFPCRYRPQGCAESFAMDNMPNHEQSCTFKPFFCPVLPLGNCPWQGSIEELHAHFAGDHHDMLLEDAYFEVDLLNDHKVHLLVPILNELFLLRIEFSNYDQMFRSTVHYIGSPEFANKFDYELTFDNNSGILFPMPKKKVDTYLNIMMHENDNMVDAAHLMQTLQNPTIVGCRLNIILVSDNMKRSEVNLVDIDDKDMEEITIQFANVTEKLLLDIECPVCQEYMVPPIYTCVRGHSVCGACKPQLRECPSCRSAMGDIRNYTLEKVTDNITYSCKNRVDGCKHLTNSKNIRNHEIECKFSPHHCPLADLLTCEWTGRVKKVIAHVKSDHPEYIQKNYFANITYNQATLSSEMEKVMEIHGEVFRLRYAYSNEKKTFCIAVQYIGPSTDACKFMYETYLSDLNKKNLQLMSKKYCGGIKDNKDDLKHSTMWHLDMVLPFMTKDNLFQIKCKILKVSK